jgi:aspartate/methionine/tyrosine aminotransferase
MDVRALLAHRSMELDASGIRRVFRLGAKMTDKIDLSIGRPHFPAPEGVKQAAIEAIRRGDNNYSMTEGAGPLTKAIAGFLKRDLGWDVDLNSVEDGGDINRPGALVTSGTSGALMLTFLALLDPGDEAILADPYFVMYPQLMKMLGVSVRLCDTYPDFRMTAERVERLINPRTKLVLLNSPGNPSGVVSSTQDCRELLELCRAKNVLLVSDEIYDEFTFSGMTEETPMGPRCPSPARVWSGMVGADRNVLVIRGFGKTYGVTGWRLGYAAGPRPLIEEMCKLQQYTFVCAPTPLQHGLAVFDEPEVRAEITQAVRMYEHNRDMTAERLGAAGYRLTRPGGAFYAFPEVPERLGVTSGEFFEMCRQRKLLIVPGKEFSKRDTHFRISLASSADNLSRGLDVLEGLAR